jgi:hypothetical protein
LVGLVDDNCDYRSVVFDGFNHGVKASIKQGTFKD